MEERLKQRLVGAMVLAALAVIFVPMLLDGVQEGDFADGDTAISPKTAERYAVESASSEPVAPLAIVEVQGETASPASQPAGTSVPGGPPVPQPVRDKAMALQPAEVKPAPTAVTAPAPAQEPTKKESGAGKGLSAWVVQVGSFSREDYALALRDELRAAGYTVFIERVRQPAGDVFRVRIGPEIERARADALRARLEKEKKLQGIVQQYP